MAGQSSTLTVAEARAMQNRIQHSGSQTKSGSRKTSSGDSTHMKKMPKKDC